MRVAKRLELVALPLILLASFLQPLEVIKSGWAVNAGLRVFEFTQIKQVIGS